jgi:hypothetical protein
MAKKVTALKPRLLHCSNTALTKAVAVMLSFAIGHTTPKRTSLNRKLSLRFFEDFIEKPLVEIFARGRIPCPTHEDQTPSTLAPLINSTTSKPGILDS